MTIEYLEIKVGLIDIYNFIVNDLNFLHDGHLRLHHLNRMRKMHSCRHTSEKASCTQKKHFNNKNKS